MPAIVITPPASEPVSLEQARKHCRIDSDITEHDWLLTLLISMAREQAEHETGRAFINRAMSLTVPAASQIQLRPCPVVSIQSVYLIDDDGQETEVAADNYRIDSARLVPRLVLSDDAADAAYVRIAFTAGYGEDAADVPSAVRRWMLLYINTHFEQRETLVTGTIVSQVPMPFSDGLLDTVRLHPGF